MTVPVTKAPSPNLTQDWEPQPYAYITSELEELIRIFHPFTQIVICQRDVDNVVDRYIQQGLANNLFGNGFLTVIRSDEGFAPDFLPPLPGREAMADDVRFIAELYSDLIGCNEIALRLEVLDKAMCPRFHVDRTGIRLVCTYHGQGTEWINDEWVDGDKLELSSLGFADRASSLLDERTRVEATGSFDITLLKGSLWQGNSQRGAIHRSPAVAAGQSRVLLVMDAVWNSNSG
jgi:hypothetical protein